MARSAVIRRVACAAYAGIVGCAIGLAAPARAVAQGTNLAYAVKAAYLYKFAPFVSWPPGTFPTTSSPFALCVIGRDPFGNLLERVTSGQTVYGRPIVIRRFETANRDTGCQIMYVAGSSAQPIPEALAAVRGTPVLTVTDGERDPGARGIINFVVQDDRVRFAIDDAAAAENRLTISSKLLSLAVAVTPRPVPR